MSANEREDRNQESAFPSNPPPCTTYLSAPLAVTVSAHGWGCHSQPITPRLCVPCAQTSPRTPATNVPQHLRSCCDMKRDVDAGVRAPMLLHAAYARMAAVGCPLLDVRCPACPLARPVEEGRSPAAEIGSHDLWHIRLHAWLRPEWHR